MCAAGVGGLTKGTLGPSAARGQRTKVGKSEKQRKFGKERGTIAEKAQQGKNRRKEEGNMRVECYSLPP